MRIAIYTQGCKVNQCETRAMERALLGRGHTPVPFEAEADAYIINTCTVTAHSDKKARILIRQTKKRRPAALLAVCGCYGQTSPQVIRELGADLVSGTGDRTAFLDELERLGSGRAQTEGGFAPAPQLPSGHTRAMLKIEDGCANFCSYCIIPYARGPVRSLPLTEAVNEAKGLAEEGYRELVLTGIEISSWGRDRTAPCLPCGGEVPPRAAEGFSPSLIDLIEAVCAAAPALRIRLGSLEPRTVTPDFCRRAAGLKNLCPHFHLSLQSGSDGILKRMNRKYDTARYAESVALLRAAYRDPAIGTDLIVGFPGESEGEFAESLAFVEALGLSSVHVFPYSRRPGTPADKLPGQVPHAVKEYRADAARALAARLERAYWEGCVGQTLPVLFEDCPDGLWQGHAPNYAPVHANGEGLHNVLRNVKITALHSDGLLGELLP